MIFLSFILHLFIGSTLAGVAAIAALVAGLDTMVPIVTAAATGFVASMPVSWVIARKLHDGG